MKKRSWISGLLLLAILAGGCAAEPVKTETKEVPFPSRWETASEPLTTEKEPLPLPVIDGPEIVRVWANSGETSAVFDLAGYASADGGGPISVRGEYDPNTAGDYPHFLHRGKRGRRRCRKALHPPGTGPALR